MTIEFAVAFSNAAMDRASHLRTEGKNELADLVSLKSGQLAGAMNYTDEGIEAWANEGIKDDTIRQELSRELFAIRNSLQPAENAARFHICDLINVYHGIAISLADKTPTFPNGKTPTTRDTPIIGALDLLEFLTGEEIHGKDGRKGQFNRTAAYSASDQALPYLKEKFPWLAEVNVDDADLSSDEKIVDFLSEVTKKFGIEEWQDIEPIPPQKHGTFTITLGLN